MAAIKCMIDYAVEFLLKPLFKKLKELCTWLVVKYVISRYYYYYSIKANKK